MDIQNSVEQNQENHIEVAENDQKFPYNIGKKDEGKLLCCWLMYPKKMYPHEILNAYFVLQLVIAGILIMTGLFNLQWNIYSGMFFQVGGLVNIIFVPILMRYYIVWFTNNKTCAFKTWFYYQTVVCVYGILWWTALLTWRLFHLNKALRSSEKNDEKNHLLLRVQQSGRTTSDDPGFIERPVGSYEEVAQQNGAAAELVLLLQITQIYNMYLHATAYCAMNKFIKQKDQKITDDRKYEIVKNDIESN